MDESLSATESAAEDAHWVTTILSRPEPRVEEECFEKLLKKYWKLVSVLAVSRIGDRREAEDICQEAFLRAFRSLDTLSQPMAFLGWLLRIARNLVTDHLRARRPHVSLDVLGDAAAHAAARDRADPRPRFEQELEALEEAEIVLEALGDLPERYRDVIALKYLRGLDGKTMASVLDEPEGTVRNRLFRALEKLREILERKGVRKT